MYSNRRGNSDSTLSGACRPAWSYCVCQRLMVACCWRAYAGMRWCH